MEIFFGDGLVVLVARRYLREWSQRAPLPRIFWVLLARKQTHLSLPRRLVKVSYNIPHNNNPLAVRDPEKNAPRTTDISNEPVFRFPPFSLGLIPLTSTPELLSILLRLRAGASETSSSSKLTGRAFVFLLGRDACDDDMLIGCKGERDWEATRCIDSKVRG